MGKRSKRLIKKLKRPHISTASMWKCYRCNLIFHEESMASLHKKISNHSAVEIDQDYGKFRLLKERRGLVVETIAN
jgi:hypothetical protein